jgi:hypothetical protein
MTAGRLDALLLFPPVCVSLEVPPVGLSYLAGHAHALGYAVEIVDVNLDVSTGMLLDEHCLTDRVAHVRQRMDRFDAQLFLSGDETTAYQRLLRLSALFSLDPQVFRRILESYARILRQSDDRAFTIGFREVFHQGSGPAGQEFAGSFAELLSLAYVLDAEAAIAAGEVVPSLTEPVTAARYLAKKVEEIRQGSHPTYFHQYVRDRLIPYLRSRRPTLVGISLCNLSQVFFGVRLAAQIKAALPEQRVIFGGNQCIYEDGFFDLMPWVGTLVDALVFGEGETPLVECIEAQRRGDPDLSTIGGVGVYQEGHLRRPAQLGQAPCDVIPAYPVRSLNAPPARYMSERRDVVAGRGCYWARCKFCTHGLVYGNDHRIGPAAATVAMLRRLVERDGVTRFYFVDEALSPKAARELSSALLEAGVAVRWACYLRLERAFADRALLETMKAAGCELVEVGLESACQRVLDAMDKGIAVATARDVLDGVLAVGIRVNVFVLLGFPTESEAEAQETVEFARQYAARGASICPSHFVLTMRSRAVAEHDTLGIELEPELMRQPVFATLEQGRHYRLRAGIDRGHVPKIVGEITAAKRPAGFVPVDLTDDTMIVRSAFVGTAPASFPVDPMGPPPRFPVAHEEGWYYLETAGLGGTLITEVPHRFVSILSSPRTLGSAIQQLCAEVALSPVTHGPSLRALARELLSAQIIAVST